MPFVETGFQGLKVFEPRVFADSRGYFFESFNKNIFREAGIDVEFVQDNESRSQRGVLRGLHYQLNPIAQAKLVRVVEGEVLDIVLDIRQGSPTYGKNYRIRLSEENKKQLYIPRGFAHGFSVLSENAIFQYKCDNYYSKESEGGILYNDPALQIDWGIEVSSAIISDKDKVLPLFKDCQNNFAFLK
ncbi:MAG: dTDP-4-dehydrorhamnose 3,5-epimerase [Bacteroidetes bacterium]|nr:dTDP-4-dehydrorhamnose 3,5-epimerase [Bacteroidota bacterium]